MGNMQRLDKVLANSGYGSRKEIKALVKQGEVLVDGAAAKDSGMQVDPEKSDIRINNKPIEYKKFIYIMMNKPAGVISATFDRRLKTVLDILPEDFRKFGVFPAGRLDIDTEGLLLLTNDGQLSHEILSPKKHVPKTYFARINKMVVQEDVEAFARGITIDDGYRCLPAQLKILNAVETSEIELTIFEGKFHQVKRMFEAVDKEVIYLKRIAMGGLKLDNMLELGESRELKAGELELLYL